MATLEFLGVGAATDFSFGQTSVLYRGRLTLLVDCGPQVPAVLATKLTGPDELDAIYVTHRHADHCFGLVSLLLWHRLNGRKRPLQLYAETETLRRLVELLEFGAPGAFASTKCFPLEYRPMQPGTEETCAGGRLRIAETCHNVKNYAVRIDDGTQNCAISGDGLVTAQTLALYAGCDWVVQECAYAEREHEWHMNLRRVLALADQIRPKGLLLTHCLAEQRASIETAVHGFGRAIRVAQLGSVISLSD